MFSGSESHFDRLADHVWSMIKDVQRGDFFRSHAPHAWRPRLNVYETPAQYMICVEIAGIDPEKIEVQMEGFVLAISGDRPRPTPPHDKDNVSIGLMEIDSGRFKRKLSLPADIESEKISASYSNGFLWIILPRAGNRGGGD